MKQALFLAPLAAAIFLASGAFGQAATEIIAPGATVTTPPGSTVTTIVHTPEETTTTKVTSTGGQSMMYKLKNGGRLEIDSDDSAYIVYDDGARVTAPDGIHTLMAGSTVTVKDGKRIP